MKNKNKIPSFFIIITLVSAMLLTALLGMISAGAETVFSPDFSNPALNNNRSIPPSLLVSIITEGEISSAEAEYLDGFFESVPLYSDFIQNDNITVTVSDKITVTVTEKSYIAANGSTVTWIPESISLGNKTGDLTLSEGVYTAVFDSAAEGDKVRVGYTSGITLSADYVQGLINFAYTDAARGADIVERQQQTLGVYMEAMALYKDYLDALEKFEEDSIIYEDYLEAKQLYEHKYSLYLNYLAQKNLYENALADYNKYLADYAAYLLEYEEYLRIVRENEEAITVYEKYLNEVTAATVSLDVMESLFISPSNKKTGPLIGALRNSELIGMFEKYKDTLAAVYKVDKNTINTLVSVSDELNLLLDGYEAAREESTKAAFLYYKANYNEISAKFNFLYDGMTNILTGTIFNHICGMIEIEYKIKEEADYKKWRLKNVLAHIYLICMGLDDSETAGNTFVFYTDQGRQHTYYFTDLLAPNLIINDKNTSSPHNLSWPQEVEFFPLPVLPVAPVVVSVPHAPEVYPNPTPPKQVTPPTAPSSVDYPGLPPQTEEKDARLLYNAEEIMEELREGRLISREGTGEYTLTLKAENEKPLSLEGKIYVSVYSYDGKISGCEEVTEGKINLPDTLHRPPDNLYEYSFIGWSTSPYLYSPIPQEITEEICAFPFYDLNERLYRINFEVREQIFTRYYKYGELPVFEGDTSKPSTHDTDYTFAGWSPYVNKVKKDADYTAAYEESERKYAVTFTDRGRSQTKNYTYGSMPSPPESFGKSYVEGVFRFDFDGWGEISPVDSQKTYTARYHATPLVSSPGGDVTLTVTGPIYTAAAGGKSMKIGELLSFVQSTGGRIVIQLDGVALGFEDAAVASLYEKSVQGVIVSTEGSPTSPSRVKITLLDENDRIVYGVPDIRVRVKMQNAESSRTYVKETDKEIPSAVSGGEISFIAKNGYEYIIGQKYKITAVQSEGGTILVKDSLLERGKPADITFVPEHGFRLDKIKITNITTGKTELSDTLFGFLMPEYDVKIEGVFLPVEYLVTFVVNGETVYSAMHKKGDILTPPQVEMSYESDGYLYEFIGWTPRVSAVTGDVTYIAKYSLSLISNTGDIGEGNALDTILKEQIIPIAVVFMAIIAGVLFFFMLRAIRRKSR